MNVEIAQRLAARRRQAGLSQEALAEQLGVSRQAVSKWERSESSPDTDNLIALAGLYGVSLDDLLYVGDEMRDDVVFEAADRAAGRATYAAAQEVPSPEGESRASDADGGTQPADAGAAEAVGEGFGAAGAGADAWAQASSAGGKAKVSLGFDGKHVLDGGDYAHLSWKDGIHVKEAKTGEEVHIGWRGIHVKDSTWDESSSGDTFVMDGDGVVINDERFDSLHEAHAKYGHSGWQWNEPCGYTVCGERFDTLDEARAKYGPEVGKSIPVRKHYLREFEKAWVKFPYPLVVIVVYLLLGILNGAWAMGLFLFFTIPVYYMVGHAVGRRRIAPLVAGAYPLAVTAWFCWMVFVNNAPHPAWVSFLTIPLVEWLVVSLSRWWRERRARKEAAKDTPIDVEAG